jgi:lysophospholipase L1-like esterase
MGKRYLALLVFFAAAIGFLIDGGFGVCLASPIAISFPLQNYLFIGRFDFSDPAGPRFAWSTSTVKARFQGTEASASLKSNGDNWFNVIIDNTVMKPINVKSGAVETITLAAGLSSGTHTIELVKRTEGFVGDVQFLGFTFGQGKILAPSVPSARRIEFIGDSLTCGYGNEGSSQYQNFTTKNENAYLAYGAVAARALDADLTTVAWSGKGVIRNYDGSTNELVPEVYPRILPYNETPRWNPGQWVPQVVIINLGTNDFGPGVPDSQSFKSAYSDFVKRIRAQYPDAHIYCALGPALNSGNLSEARNYITAVVKRLNSAGDSKVRFIEFPMDNGRNGFGEDWHPSVKTHQLMAEQLVKQLKIDLGW